MSEPHYTDPAAPTSPKRQGLVLLALILVAAVANLNLSVANVALPSIGRDFDASQTSLNLIAVGYSLGLAASVLYLGALGDRYGRKLMLILGVALAMPVSVLAAFAPSENVLVIARILGGVTAGMAYPTTLALITALWAGAPRTRAIALWSGLGGAISALGPLVAGFLLEHFWWGSVFLATLPLALVALVLAWLAVPGHANETTDPVDNRGGLLSAILVAAVVLAINFVPVPGAEVAVAVSAVVAIVAGVAFTIRQRRARFPLYDLDIAGRRLFWVAAVAGIIVFGSLMAAMFVGQQYLQNVLGYDTLSAGAAILPAAVFMVLAAPLSARLVSLRGSRMTLLIGYAFVGLSFVFMLVLWQEDIPYWKVGIAYAAIGIGVGIAGTPASHSLTGSVPVTRAGMASGTADLQRDLGGAFMQSVLGAILTAGYAAAMTKAISNSPQADQVTAATESQLTKSFAGAENTAESYPQYADQIIAAARDSFLAGDKWAFSAGILGVLIGAVLVAIYFPGRRGEGELLGRYEREDAASTAGPAPEAAHH